MLFNTVITFPEQHPTQLSSENSHDKLIFFLLPLCQLCPCYTECGLCIDDLCAYRSFILLSAGSHVICYFLLSKMLLCIVTALWCVHCSQHICQNLQTFNGFTFNMCCRHTVSEQTSWYHARGVQSNEVFRLRKLSCVIVEFDCSVDMNGDSCWLWFSCCGSRLTFRSCWYTCMS